MPADAAATNYSDSGVHVEIGSTVDAAERMLILKTLESTRNNKTRAAETPGISLKTLHNKLKEYGSATSSEEWKRAGSLEPLAQYRRQAPIAGCWITSITEFE